jgi:flagellar protein FliO/FliZ
MADSSSLSDLPQYLRLIAALVFVLSLMGGLAFLVKKLGLARNGEVKGKRLKIVEALPLDARRRLVLLQRDNKQHLVILGASSETVIETNIETAHDEQS